MTYPELLTQPSLHLPVSQKKDSFKHSIKSVLDTYLHAVRTLPNHDSLHVEDLGHIDGEFVKNVQEKFIKGLLATIDIYHEGKPAKAYERLQSTMNNELKDFTQILKLREYPAGESFFRMRIYKGNTPLSSKQMFHIPFELRGLVATQRFSIPGFPCLYLGRTLYGCWEEMKRPEISEFQAARLKSLAPIRFLDLTTPSSFDNPLSQDIYHYFMTWPLIACCSVKVKDYNHPFRSEYIIPQLLLQWIRDEQRVDGIKFDSTHINTHETGSKGDFSNLVLPVKKNEEKGLCPTLCDMFEISNSLSWQLHEHAIGGQQFLYRKEDFVQLNSRIEKLELINGKPYPYSYSVLGRLEYYLDNMPTHPII